MFNLQMKRNMSQKVKIELYSYRGACLDGVTRRHNNVVYASCETLELNGEKLPFGHRMDSCDRAILLSEYGSTLDCPDYKEALVKDVEALKNRLKTVVYENENIDFEVIDKQEYSAPF